MSRDWTGRHLALLVTALFLGTLLVAGGVGPIATDGDGPRIPGFVVDIGIEIPTPSVSVDPPTTNETTPTPGVSPLPVAPDPDDGSTDAGSDTRFGR